MFSYNGFQEKVEHQPFSSLRRGQWVNLIWITAHSQSILNRHPNSSINTPCLGWYFRTLSVVSSLFSSSAANFTVNHLMSMEHLTEGQANQPSAHQTALSLVLVPSFIFTKWRKKMFLILKSLAKHPQITFTKNRMLGGRQNRHIMA